VALNEAWMNRLRQRVDNLVKSTTSLPTLLDPVAAGTRAAAPGKPADSEEMMFQAAARDYAQIRQLARSGTPVAATEPLLAEWRARYPQAWSREIQERADELDGIFKPLLNG